MMKRLFAAVLAMLLLCVVGCEKPPAEDGGDKSGEDTAQEFDEDIDWSQFMPVAVFTMDDESTFEVELYREVAPKSVDNFIKLAKSGFYNGTLIHRITISGIYVIQGGGFFLDEDGTQYTKPADNIIGEFAANGYENNLSHEEGVISMARAPQLNSASSQFFICYSNSSSLDGEYATFGKVRTGLEVVKEIARSPISGETPVNNIIIKSVTIKYVQHRR